MPSRFRPADIVRKFVEDRFPVLRTARWSVKSPWNDTYQCYALAVCRTDVLWWPQEIYWPPHAPVNDDVEAFVLALSEYGYVPCDTSGFEFGYQKVAIYGSRDGCVLHMARQRFFGGGWLSKLGDSEDIVHEDLKCLEGDISPLAIALGKSYGRVAQILKRTWWSAFINRCLFRCLQIAIRFWLYRMRHPSWIRDNIRRRSSRPAVN